MKKKPTIGENVFSWYKAKKLIRSNCKIRNTFFWTSFGSTLPPSTEQEQWNSSSKSMQYLSTSPFHHLALPKTCPLILIPWFHIPQLSHWHQFHNAKPHNLSNLKSNPLGENSFSWRKSSSGRLGSPGGRNGTEGTEEMKWSQKHTSGHDGSAHGNSFQKAIFTLQHPLWNSASWFL